MAIIIVFTGLVTVNQGTIAVITMFGKYRRILMPGLNFKIPILEQVNKTVSIQNRSVELEFQAVTVDQANVYFKSMLLYSVINQDEQTIKNVAFKFISEKDLMQALIRTVEGSIRAFVATKKQAKDIVAEKAAACNMPYITERWPGGTLTNFVTIRKAVKKMASIDRMKKDGTFMTLSKKERLQVDRLRAKLEKNLGSIADMSRLPAAL